MSPNSAVTPVRARTLERWLGAGLLTHVVLLAWLKVSRGLPGEMLWISHAALALAGAGFLIGSMPIRRVALAAVLGVHTLWMGDFLVGLAAGVHPLGLTAYVLESDWAVRLATSHHLYLAPVLFWRAGWIVRWRECAAAVVLMGGLTMLSRGVLPESLNVNMAHALPVARGSRVMGWYHALPAPAYLAIHAGVYAVVLCALPVLGARRVGRWMGGLGPATVATGPTRRAPSRRGAFTLVEMIAVIVVIGILIGVAMPRYFNWTSRAQESADEGSLGGIRAALEHAHLQHRLTEAGSGSWVEEVEDLPAIMETGLLPEGITIVDGRLQDQRGNLYDLTPETSTTPARLTIYSGGGGS